MHKVVTVQGLSCVSLLPDVLEPTGFKGKNASPLYIFENWRPERLRVTQEEPANSSSCFFVLCRDPKNGLPHDSFLPQQDTSCLILPWHRNAPPEVKPGLLDACGKREGERPVLVPFCPS